MKVRHSHEVRVDKTIHTINHGHEVDPKNPLHVHRMEVTGGIRINASDIAKAEKAADGR